MSTLFLADAPVSPGAPPIGDGGLHAPGFWSRLRALRAEQTGHDTVGRLRAAVAVERRLARQFAADANWFRRHPDARAGLLGLAARADDCAERLAAALGELGSGAATGAASPAVGSTDRERICADIDDLRTATERYLDDACAVARHHPWLSRLLLAIREDKAQDLRELVQLRARLGLDGPDDGSALVPAVLEPDPDPLIGRLAVAAAA